MSTVNDAISSLRTIITQSTDVLSKNLISPSEKAQMEGIQSSAYTALSQILTSTNQTNTGFGQAYASAEDAAGFINEAKGLLDQMYEDDTNELNNLRTTNSTQLKQIQFNNYFAQRYNYNVGIMKVLVITSVLLMICIFLHNKSLLPTFLYTILLSIIIAVAVIIVFTMLISEIKRSNTNFNEFQWASPKT
jgi:hypothetical protein